MKVLTVISTIFMPLTVLTGMYGMNVPLPHLPGGEHAQFWWIVGHHGRGRRRSMLRVLPPEEAGSDDVAD